MTNRQKEILTASIKIAGTNGMQSLTIKNIAAKIGLTEAALYRHFHSKDQIILGIIALFNASSERDFNPDNINVTSAVEQLKELMLKRIEEFEKFPEIAYIMLSLDVFMHNDDLKEAAAETLHKHKDFVLKLIAHGQEISEIREDIPPKELFRIIMGSFRLLLTQWFLKNYEFDLKGEFEKLWNTIHTLIKK